MPPPARVITSCVGEVLVSLLRLSAESLRTSAVEQALVQTLEKQFQFSMGHRPSSGEVRSWSASLPVAGAERVYTILQATGLDPQRTDRLLLLKPGQDRKQQRREAAARDWCIVAIAGDRRADFDEAFDYLRDPQGPVAQALESHFGAGWFLAPPPID